MTEEKFSIEVPVPKQVLLLDDEVSKEVLEEVKKEIAPKISDIVVESAKRIVAKKLALIEEKVEAKKVEETVKKEKKKFCKSCGREAEFGAKFCRFCGAKL